MSWGKDDIIYSHLFIAAPELIWEDEVIEYLIRRGTISNEALVFIARLKRDKARLARIRRQIKGRPLFARIMAIAPEIISVPLVDLLSKVKLLTKQEAHVLRLGVRAGGALFDGPLASRSDVLRRARRLFGLGYSEEAIALLRSMDAISIEEANKLRAVILTSGVSFETLKKLRMAKTWVDMLALVGSGLIDKRAIDAMRLSGMLDTRTANALLNALAYGKAEWTVWEGAKRAEGLAARMAYVASGSFSFEALELLKSAGMVSAEQEKYLLAAVQISQIYNRELMEQFTDRKYRVVSGEAPIATYARAMKETDDQLLKLLAEAAEEARKQSERLSGVRGAQYALNARQLHVAMRQVWEGVGYLTIFGEHRVADAAIQSTEMLQGVFRSALPEGTRRMLEVQARAGLDSYISRKENTLQLSRRVYGNMNIWTGKVDKTINLGILQGKSAKEIADSVKSMINPKVPGGMKYAAMRLGRTELANSFHFTTIRHTREMPWVQGYKWNKSSSHRHGDICDEYAENDHDGIGQGVFKKANVPGKPHPQCMCYVTAVTPSEKDFINNWKKGLYDQYFSSMASSVPGIGEQLKQEALTRLGTFVGQTAGKIAVTQGMRSIDRMMDMERHGRVKSQSINPTKIVGPKAHQTKAFFHDTIEVNAHTDDKAAKALARDAEKYAGSTSASAKAVVTRQSLMNEMRARESAYDRLNGDGSFDLDNYRQTLQRFPHHFPDEEAAVSIYGTRAHQAINMHLRNAKGKLPKYDKEFGYGSDFFDRFKGAENENDLFDLLVEYENEGLSIDAEETDPDSVTPIQNYFGELFRRTWDRGEDLPKWRKHSEIVEALDKTMEKTSRDTINYRITGDNWLGLDRPASSADIGLVFKDFGYTSTEGIKAYFANTSPDMLSTGKRANRVRILVPKGTFATRVNDIENEIAMARGTTYQLIGVTPDTDPNSPFQNILDVIILGQDDPFKKKAGKKSAEADMWDEVFGDF